MGIDKNILDKVLISILAFQVKYSSTEAEIICFMLVKDSPTLGKEYTKSSEVKTILLTKNAK
jgi:hypothetical protein